MAQRSEPRLPHITPIRIFGMDATGRPIHKEAATRDVSRRGARVFGVTEWQLPGEVIGLRKGTQKARYQIVWVGKTGTPVEGQVGLRCMEAGKDLWEEAFRRPMTSSEAPPPAADPSATIVQSDIRREARYRVFGGARIVEMGKEGPIWTNLSDLSLGGCYLETGKAFVLDTPIQLAIDIRNIHIDAQGAVATVDPMVGMGIRFTQMDAANRERLRTLIQKFREEITGSGKI